MKKYVIFVCLGITGLLALVLFEYKETADGMLHVVFCDVGQGDGILLKTPSGRLILVDGGRDDSILECLSAHTAFWQRTVDLSVLTHPHGDHFMGLFSVFPIYTVKSHVSEKLVNRSESYEVLQDLVKNEGLETFHVARGNKITVGDGVVLTVLMPTDEYLLKTSPEGYIGQTEDDASLIILVSYGTFSMLLTGDSEVSGMVGANPPNIDVLHVPHHGSRFGLNAEIVQQIDPEVAVISVGKNNYGHPSHEILEILGNKDIRILRTDQIGDIEVVSDGKQYWVEK